MGLLVALPILGMAAVVVFSREPEELVASLADNRAKIAVAVLLVGLAAGSVGYAFWRGLTRPLAALNAQAERVASGGREFDARGPFGTHELARLGGSVATMVDELQRRSRTVETFSNHLAHELKSPLTSIRGAAELMRDEGDAMAASQRERFLTNIVEDAARLTVLVDRLRDLARADMAVGPGKAEIVEAAARAGQRFPGLAVKVSVPAGEFVPLALEHLVIALGHLFDNAVRHGARTASVSFERKGTAGTIIVENDGAPIPVGDRTRVAEPFFTTRREDGGTGMGLAIVTALLAPAGGRLDLASADPVRFALRFEGASVQPS